MSPADELRAAATQLEELAAAASDGRWSAPQRLTDPDPDGWDMLNGLEGMAEHQVFATSDICNPRGHADLTWAATMCPQVAAPLVDLFRTHARGAEAFERTLAESDEFTPEQVRETSEKNLRLELAVARVINGATS